MNLSPVVIAIPMYFILMAIEMIALRFQKHPGYRLNDAVTNINCGVISQVTGVFIKILSIGIYTLIYQHLAFFQIPNNIWTFLLLFFLYDFCYYWAHRMSHEINLFWGGHVVHHSSEEYNLSVALRQSSTQTIWTFFFYFPLALLGFDPVMLVLASGINLLYQFWIHTEAIDRMGFLEKFMNTPSHHRVHHGRNPKYIDKNHAGTFIIFDKWFGTFQEEEEKPTYGITTPVKSWNPVWVNVAHYSTMKDELKMIPYWSDRVKYLFNKPGWLPDYLGGYRAPKEVESDYQKFDTVVPPSFNWYVLTQYIFVLLLTGFFLFKVESFTWMPKVLVSAIIIWTTVSFSGVFEKRGWYLPQELIRILAFVGVVFFLIQSLLPLPILIVVLSTYTLTSFFWLWKNQQLKSQIPSISL
ncbi:sterol desaturase family protein [Algoriphagus winogradskyi]|uniref:Sterol desaturase/sphingolipid hydroxylase, fatty acid hydroxylase superfamily n=1 Tax=Algoriphagus winogradskyi TaxID=237017 RepID=A0ABY1N6Y3_9BACT|nr:sterol desaturase family protein [Algoriphagus winogradskyi]SMP02053.1 Sterol desaturase/sphingolipid hydroxylase, fatty acid hydroxylase superfamily [Algoriphagus winogradskyi]|tara:strand:+ start:18207 stop:19439 length:1233 start_codon:yes stop_codon:yes gene_type:complete